jgi:hypothetical protein
MKKLLLLIGLVTSSFFAQAGTLDDIFAAMRAAQQEAGLQNQEKATTQTVIRGYLATANGFTSVSAATSGIGSLVPKSIVLSAVASAGFTLTASQNRVDFFKASSASMAGFILLVYYDAAGNGSEIYLLNDSV